MKKLFKFLLCVLLFGTILQAQTLIMAYRETPRLPLIGDASDNSGLYYELFSTAASKMNIDLKVIRLPKKRILHLLQTGEIDFYPGFTFTQNRANYVYFMKNGMNDGGDMGISLQSFPLIENLDQLKGKKVVTAFGGPRVDILSKIEGIDLYSVPRLSLEKAIILIEKKRYDFYIYNSRTIQYYLKKNHIKNLKIHPNCCGGSQPMYLGFSKKSHYYEEVKNPNYDGSKPVSVDNYPTTVSKDSIAYKLKTVLQEMEESGETQRIVDKYYK